MNRSQLRQLKKRKNKPMDPIKRANNNRPNLAEVLGRFGHIDIMFDQLRGGYVDSAQGKPIMHDGQGGWHEIAPALLGWVDLWDRIAEKYQLVIDTRSLSLIANRLQYGVPLTHELIQKGQSAIDHCRRIYSMLNVYEVRQMVNDQCRDFEIQDLIGKTVMDLCTANS